MSGLRLHGPKAAIPSSWPLTNYRGYYGGYQMKNANLAVIEQPATRINNLHKELREHGQSMVQKAIQAGGLLVEQKERVGHGHWLKWIEGNLIFSGRTAQHYIKCYHHRDQLNAKRISHLGEAVGLLASPKKESLSDINWEHLKVKRELALESPDWPICKVCSKNKVMHDNCSTPEPKRHGLCEECDIVQKEERKEERKAQKKESKTANALEAKQEFEKTPVDPEAEKSCKILSEFLNEAVNGIISLDLIIGKVSVDTFDCLESTIRRFTGVLYCYRDEVLDTSTYEGET